MNGAFSGVDLKAGGQIQQRLDWQNILAPLQDDLRRKDRHRNYHVRLGGPLGSRNFFVARENEIGGSSRMILKVNLDFL